MRYAILLLATGFSTVAAAQNARLQQADEPSHSLVVAAVCEAARADANRLGAATLDILPCDRPAIDHRTSSLDIS